jgi:Kef-type K+ transport system membrane component KefB
MSSSISNLKALLPLSLAIALTGLLAPIALSFILVPLNPSQPLHAFAAGSALSSTSLGTVLAVLQPASIGFDLRKTAFGTALLSAAVMDDIVAFILVKVLTILGSEGDPSSAYLGGSIGRTIGVTIGLGVALLCLARWVLKPAYMRLKRLRWFRYAQWGGEGALFVLLAILFIGMVCAAGYGGTSPLYGAYIAGLAVAYLSDCDQADADSIELEERSSTPSFRPARRNTFPSAAHPAPTPTIKERRDEGPTLVGTFERYVAPVLTYLLLPLFFGSIGYSIPFVPLWRGRIIWRGIVYSILMLLGKVFCGGWMLLRGTRGWRAAMILGCAMISRGEIGLLSVSSSEHLAPL